jgi:adenylate cyclase
MPDSPEPERRLSAILSADVHGFSRLMGADEPTTVRTMMAYREVMARLVGDHRGRVFDFSGDSLMAEFASAVDAVHCAAALQEELATRNADLPEDRRMQFRIGLHLGEVLVEGEQIFGDDVNIAARIQSVAEAGGISVSSQVHEQVCNKVAFAFESLGEHAVKNIARPIHVYRLQLPPPAAAAAPSPDMLSIAVLPFATLGDDPAQEHFSDGLTRDLITDLAKIDGVAVTAASSVFAYKGTAVNVQEVGRDLGVGHVVEGSVRQAGDRMRITVDLVDVATGLHVWAERYDREVDDPLALQDELVSRIVAELVPSVSKPPGATPGGDPGR